MIKKSSRFIALIFVALTCSVSSMKRAHAERPWVETVGAILLNQANIQGLLHFTDLPLEILQHIIYLLNANAATQSLEDAAKDISTLALVDKDLNEFINDPGFCLRLIKHLSQKFDCSNQEVAEALQTKEARRRLELQNHFYNLLCNNMILNSFGDKYIDVEDNKVFEQNLEQFLANGADVNFTYYEDDDTLLEGVYLRQEHSRSKKLIQWLIQHGINQNQKNDFLMFIIGLFHGGSKIKDDALEVIKILLDANADPEFTNEGKSMLSLMQEVLDEAQQRKNPTYPYYSQDIKNATIIIEMLEDAIKRKHGRK